MDRLLFGIIISKLFNTFFRTTCGAIDIQDIPRHKMVRISMASLTGLLVKRLFRLSSREDNLSIVNQQYKLMMLVISRRHLPLRFTPSPSGILSIYTRCLNFHPLTGIMTLGNENGYVILILPDGRQISHKMQHYVTDVSMLSSDLLSVCFGDNYAVLFRITPECTLSHVANLHHTNDVNCACMHPVFGLIATGSRDRSVKVWTISPEGPSECLVFNKHSAHVNNVFFHPELPLLASSSSDGKVFLTLLSTDGKNVLSTKRLGGQNEGYTRIVFHPDPKMRILVTAGIGGRVIVWTFEISPSNHILTKYLVIDIPTLKDSWISSMCFHPRDPVLLLGSGHNFQEMKKNVPVLIFFSEDFTEVRTIRDTIIDGCGEGGGTVRGSFLQNGKFWIAYYNRREILDCLLQSNQN